MNIVVFGANGRVGQLVVQTALSRGHLVVAAVHSANPFSKNKQLDVHEVDVFDESSVSSALTDADAVISCLGSWGTESKNILTQGVKNIIPAMKQHGVQRIASLTGSAAFALSDNPNLIDKANRTFLRIFAAPILDDGEQHIQLLTQSSLQWTIVRSPVMNNLGQSNYVLSTNSPLPTQTINRRAVATALVDVIESNQLLQQAPFITRN